MTQYDTYSTKETDEGPDIVLTSEDQSLSSKANRNGLLGQSIAQQSPAAMIQQFRRNSRSLQPLGNLRAISRSPSANNKSRPMSRGPTPLSFTWASDACNDKLRQQRSLAINLSPFDTTKFLPMVSVTSLPPSERSRVMLAIDLDETLVHASIYKVGLGETIPQSSVAPDMVMSFGRTGTTAEEIVHIRYRPHVKTFLEAVSQMFTVVIFTASTKEYADAVLNALDPSLKYVGKFRLYREHCVDVKGVKVKDLSFLGKPLHRIALIDNSSVSFMLQPRNGIPIISWFEDSSDAELLKLLPMLKDLAQADSVHDILDIYNAIPRQ